MSTTDRRSQEPALPLAWHRVPEVWLALLLPAAAVVAGFVTLGYAMSGPSAALAEPTQKVGVAQTADLSADRTAAARALDATLLVQSDRLALVLRGGESPGMLMLDAIHPTDPQRDHHVALARDADGNYGGSAALDPEVRWQFRLAPPDRHWRLSGRAATGAARVDLRPSIDAG